MKIEHVALNVPDALSMGRWYVDHLGLTVKRRTMDSPWAHFLADDSGTVMIEIYQNESAEMLAFPTVPPPALHLAFVSQNVEQDCIRLESAGAVRVSGPEKMPSGDIMAMLRDPWGVCLQLVHRAQPMLGKV